MVKYPVAGGFVPAGAKRADGSPHPHAGTGFGLSTAQAWPQHDRDLGHNADRIGRRAYPGAQAHEYLELQQLSYDGSRFRAEKAKAWTEVEMTFLVNDRWRAEFTPEAPGAYRYSIIAWRDLYAAWLRDTKKKIAAGQRVDLEAEEGRLLIADALEADPAPKGGDARALKSLAKGLEQTGTEERLSQLMAPELEKSP